MKQSLCVRGAKHLWKKDRKFAIAFGNVEILVTLHKGSFGEVWTATA